MACWPTLASPRQLLLDHSDEALQRLGARELPPVDEKARRAGHASAGAFLHVLLHSILVFPTAHAQLEGRKVEPHLLGIGLQVLRAALRRVGVEHVVIRPELPLLVGAPGRLMPLPRLWVEVIEDRKST